MKLIQNKHILKMIETNFYMKIEAVITLNKY